MAWSFRVGRLFGIDVRVHVVFLALVAWLCLDAIFKSGSTAMGALVLLEIFLLFGFVLLHELGHSLMAQRKGIRVRDITLWPLGGLARLEGYTENPRSELLIAAAGPAVNLVLAALLYPFTWSSTASPFEYAPASSVLGPIVGYAFYVNILMGVVNLIPAFPLDGGRILRGILASRLSWLRATEIAVSVGKVIAWITLLLCALYSEFWIALLSLFVIWAGSAELRVVRAREALRAAAAWGFPEGDVIEAEVVDRGGGPEAPSPPTPPPDGLDNLKPFEREFLERMERLRRKQEGKGS